MTNNKRGRATIADVARLAGVAKSSVSNYLNGQIRVAEATRSRIALAIADLDYKPAETARSLTSRRRSNVDIARLDAWVPCLTTVGHVSVDFIAPLDHLPHRQNRMMAREILKAVGGPAANVAAFAAGLGDEARVACSLLTSVGNDIDSDWAIAELGSRRVDIVTPAASRQGRLARAIVMVEPLGQRTIIAEPILVGEVDLDVFIATHDTQGRRWCLHFEGFQVTRHMANILKARRAGFLTSMHTTGVVATWFNANLDLMLDHLDLLVIQQETLHDESVEHAITRLSDLAKRRNHWPAGVVISCGIHGLVLIDAAGRVYRAAPSAIDPVDETGASDAIVGTILALWLNGLPVPATLAFAVEAASLVSSRIGAQELRPTLSDLVSRTGVTPMSAAKL
ncbi:PfkB family carbohydrate kinase [Loktanella salsilacus]|uniref:carbohydrate kinase family protein n=1 Tax=Loktanella salsilacus TaxID=195913 RepID=UPI00373541AD